MGGRAPVLVLAAALGTVAPAAASGPEQAALPARPVLTASLALRAVEAAVARCREQGHRVSAAVVDRAGRLLAQLRDEQAGPHTLDSSRRKAFTAASLGRPTAFYAGLAARRPELAGLRTMSPEILLLGGGLPVRFRGELVGGIGVGGAPGARLDEGCARAGLQAMGADLPGEAGP